MMKLGSTLRSIGPAIIVAAVVLGPGSILTSSKVGAQFGWVGLPVLAVAAFLMIGMVALSARLGVVFEGSLCDELARRLNRAVAVTVALVLFILIALYQSSNNVAVIGGLEPILETDEGASLLDPLWARVLLLVVLNGLVIASLYAMRSVYGFVEKAMKILILLMSIAFLVNFITALVAEPVPKSDQATKPGSWLPLLAMVGTTFSVAGAFFQAYLVREKGWGLRDLKKGLLDSIVGISVLGLITAVILTTSIIVFYRNPAAPELRSVGDVARQMEPLFGSAAKYVFCGGILAGALSSFLVNSVIGGTVLSDGLGLGSRMEDKWARHFTTLSLLTGMAVGFLGLGEGDGRVVFITIAQALTVFGIPALAVALLFLALQKDLIGERRVPRFLIVMAMTGTAVALFFAVRLGMMVVTKISAMGG